MILKKKPVGGSCSSPAGSPAGSSRDSTGGSSNSGPAGSPEHDLLTRKEAAYLLRLKPNTLAVWAVKGRFAKELPIIRLGKNLIRYRRSDLERFIAAHVDLQDPGESE